MSGLRRVYLARPRGFCAGVVMAIEAVERWAEALKEKGELVVYHEIVHNRVVVERLQAKGVHFVEDLAEVERLRRERRLADTVVFSAHGHPPAVRRQAAEMGLTVLDATCPLVTKVHTEAKRYAKEGYWILLIGDSADHQEIKGTYGEAPRGPSWWRCTPTWARTPAWPTPAPWRCRTPSGWWSSPRPP